jgi:8-oxo-dGTP pyrophosphatase MutT (NUDIX family)
VHRRRLLGLIDRYQDVFPEDAARADAIRCFVERHPDCFERSCGPGHLTGSAWIVSRDGVKVLLVRHRKLGAWLQPGGHADGDPDASAVARREAVEESGLLTLEPVVWTRQDADAALPFDVDVHPIPARAGKPAHLHFDLRYLFVADGAETPRASVESDDVAWVPLAELSRWSEEPSLLRMAAKAARLLDPA